MGTRLRGMGANRTVSLVESADSGTLDNTVPADEIQRGPMEASPKAVKNLGETCDDRL